MQQALYIFSGLPGVGKSALAKALARHLRAAYLRIDTIEQGLRDLCALDVQGEGYRLAYRLAADNLRLGLCVVADSCNPIELTRSEWQEVARLAGVSYINIEVVCSDLNLHRQRVEARVSEVPGLAPVTWQEVQSREYHVWKGDRIIIDTAHHPAFDSEEELLRKVAELHGSQLTTADDKKPSGQ